MVWGRVRSQLKIRTTFVETNFLNLSIFRLFYSKKRARQRIKRNLQGNLCFETQSEDGEAREALNADGGTLTICHSLAHETPVKTFG